MNVLNNYAIILFKLPDWNEQYQSTEEIYAMSNSIVESTDTAHRTMYSVLWASQACSIFTNSSSIRSTIVSMQPRMWYGGPCNTTTNT